MSESDNCLQILRAFMQLFYYRQGKTNLNHTKRNQNSDRLSNLAWYVSSPWYLSLSDYWKIRKSL